MDAFVLILLLLRMIIRSCFFLDASSKMFLVLNECVNFQIMESPNPPILLPIWIHGMAEVWPQLKPYYPRIGKVRNMVLNRFSL